MGLANCCSCQADAGWANSAYSGWAGRWSACNCMRDCWGGGKLKGACFLGVILLSIGGSCMEQDGHISS